MAVKLPLLKNLRYYYGFDFSISALLAAGCYWELGKAVASKQKLQKYQKLGFDEILLNNSSYNLTEVVYRKNNIYIIMVSEI